jgi:putative transposase
MNPKPQRDQNQGCLHLITFSCFQRRALLDPIPAREVFECDLERVRQWYGCYVTGYVVMPEHVHMLMSEPERCQLWVAIQMLKQITSRELRPSGLRRFWQVRYYDFPVWSEEKKIEKLRYLHRNPVKCGLCERPEGWKWGSFLQWATGAESRVEIECPSTARRREGIGMLPTFAAAHPPAQNAGSVGQPHSRS